MLLATRPRLGLPAGILCSWFLLARILTGGADAIKITRLDVPLFVDPRSPKVALRCEYDLEDLALYTVKWYRNDQEFFCYTPGATPPGQVFDVKGVKVDLARSNAEEVVLVGQTEGVNLAGIYTCEVSTEGPNFFTDYAEANMSVAVVPKRDPALEGVRAAYEIDEILEAECTSAPSYPPATLTFILNDKEVPASLTRNITPQASFSVESGSRSLELSTSRLGLTLRLDRTNFPGESLSLICRSVLPGIPAARARKTEATSTLAANNQPHVQEPPTLSTAPCNPVIGLSSLLVTVAALVFALDREPLGFLNP